MGDSKIIIRVVSEAGRNRIEIDPKATVKDLKEIISEKIGIDVDAIKLYEDIKYKNQINWTNAMTLTKAKIKNGDQLFIPNKNAKFQDLVVKPKKAEEEEKIPTSHPSKIKPTETITKPTGEETKGKEEDGRSPEWSHGPKGKCLHCISVDKTNYMNVEYKCNHPKDQMWTNWKDLSKIQDAKHVPFDHLLSEMRAKWKKKHKPDQRCQDCIPIENVSYKMRRDCTSHKPYPLGMCNKWTPPSVILNRQRYRHVDYICILNYPELQGFVDAWQSSHCMEQRVAWLYGYYSEDPNYPEGVRVNIEAIYDPPQIGEMNGYQILHDSNEDIVNMIAESLTLERVGFIYTSLNYESFLTPKEVREIAKMQEKFSVEHPEGVRVSKFVTIVVKPKGDSGESGLDCYMVSDLCQALERDNVFDNSEDSKLMTVREAEENEMIPSIIKEGKSVKEFDPEYFIVSISHGQPKEMQDFNILKNYDFLAQNRQMRPNRNDLKNYIKAHKSLESEKKFANFQFLIYLSQQLDIDTVCAIGDKIAKEEPLEDFLVELVENLA